MMIFNPSSAVPSGGRSFGYPAQTMAAWMSADGQPNQTGKLGEMNATWRPEFHESPMSPSFVPYPGQAQSAQWATPVVADSASREDIDWPSYPPPPRSMAYGSDSLGGRTHQFSEVNRSLGQKPVSSTLPYHTMPGGDSLRSGNAALGPNVSLTAGTATLQNYSSWPAPAMQSQQQSEAHNQQQPYPFVKPTGDGYSGWAYGESN